MQMKILNLIKKKKILSMQNPKSVVSSVDWYIAQGPELF